MLKKILNKNLLAALVIGGSLGLTNADMCMAATISCYGNKIEEVCSEKGITLDSNQVCQIPGEATSIQKQIDQLFAYCASVETTTPTTFYIINGKALLEQNDTTKIGWKAIVKNLPKLSETNVVCCGAVNNSLKSNVVKGMVDSLKEQCHEHNTLLNVETYGGGSNYFYCVRTLTTEEQKKKTDKANEIETLKNSIAGFQTVLNGINSEMEPLKNDKTALINEIKSVKENLISLTSTVENLMRRIAALESKPVVLNDEEGRLKTEEELRRKVEQERIAKEEAEKKRIAKEKAEKELQEQLEKERIAKEEAEKERIAKEKAERELQEQLEKERIAKEKAEKEKNKTSVYTFELD